MIYPTRENVLTLRKKYSMIPLCQRVLADTETPISLYDRVKDQPYSFLLESVEGGKRWSRYSFVGSDPFFIVKGKGEKLVMTERDKGSRVVTEEPFSFLASRLEQYRSPSYKGFPPFLGGAVGYAGYEMVRYIEPARPITKPESICLDDDFHFMFVDQLLVFDHLKQEVVFVCHLHVSPEMSDSEVEQAYYQTARHLKKWASEFLLVPVSVPPLFLGKGKVTGQEVQANIDKNRYMQMVEKAKEYIRKGDIFQVVLSRRLTWEPAPPPFEVYRALRVLNPSPYMYYLRLGNETVVGSSPELLVRVTDSVAETCPIAGSRPRGKDEREDQALIDELIHDEKERAEHVMLVDLGRNDLGRVAKYGTVKVTDFMKIEKYSHIMHLVSRVSGKLMAEKKELDAFKACFPAGTLSGAPKVRAMEIICELEPTPRGIYGGAIGYFSFGGNLDSCIAIRTIVFRDGKAWVQSGGGIVADSDPEAEFMESWSKALGMLKALAMVSDKKVEEYV
ncbi:anthranilate synthase component I [Thermoactinomyces mirandus]|uniref:Anthranilate synthase component 1 n=1 Tax=Thermoactinomyces mirandus TaxID=2756294 RepID=A0A7W1XSX5_9BACL|nr:anthranilate synthase component I [Thermoactinomyces mirandus]MBA4602552.1 anthranilate synthase component I [Thermoactinomyces mirandus]